MCFGHIWNVDCVRGYWARECPYTVISALNSKRNTYLDFGSRTVFGRVLFLGQTIELKALHSVLPRIELSSRVSNQMSRRKSFNIEQKFLYINYLQEYNSNFASMLVGWL